MAALYHDYGLRVCSSKELAVIFGKDRKDKPVLYPAFAFPALARGPKVVSKRPFVKTCSNRLARQNERRSPLPPPVGVTHGPTGSCPVLQDMACLACLGILEALDLP